MIELPEEIQNLLGPIHSDYVRDSTILENMLFLKMMGMNVTLGDFISVRNRIYERIYEIDNENAKRHYEETVKDLMTESFRRSQAQN